MSEPCKMFNFVMPYKIYERLRTLAKEHETSVGNLVRKGIDLLLKEKCSGDTKSAGN